MYSAHSALKVGSWDSHIVPQPIVSGGVLLSTKGPVLLCALIGLPAAVVEEGATLSHRTNRNQPECVPDAYLILPWLQTALEMKSNLCLFNNTPSLTWYSERKHRKAWFITEGARSYMSESN